VERESRWRSIRRNASKQSIESVSCNGFAVPLSGHSLAQLLGTPRRELDGHRPIAKAKSVTASYIPQFELESAQLSKIASCLAVEAEVPVGDTCCGTAGDRGLLHPRTRGVRNDRHKMRARCQAGGRPHFSKQNLRNGALACDRAPIPIVCLPTRGIESTGTANLDWCRVTLPPARSMKAVPKSRKTARTVGIPNMRSNV
jgi:hypothetical protein